MSMNDESARRAIVVAKTKILIDKVRQRVTCCIAPCPSRAAGRGLTRALLRGGGGRNAPPPCTFPSIAQKRKGVGLQNFRKPLSTSILHMLTKGKFRTYDRSAVSDVRVTSCSAILGQK